MTFSPPPVYPADMPLAELRTAELLLATTLRLFARTRRRPDESGPDWRSGLLAAGLPLWTAGAFDGLLGMVAAACKRPLEVRCPRCGTLSRDEARLLQIVSLFQHHRPELAQAALGDWLPPGAQRLAAGPAQALARAMRHGGLVIPWRHAQAAHLGSIHAGAGRGLALVQ
jgi:hypothetical protein